MLEFKVPPPSNSPIPQHLPVFFLVGNFIPTLNSSLSKFILSFHTGKQGSSLSEPLSDSMSSSTEASLNHPSPLRFLSSSSPSASPHHFQHHQHQFHHFQHPHHPLIISSTLNIIFSTLKTPPQTSLTIFNTLKSPLKTPLTIFSTFTIPLIIFSTLKPSLTIFSTITTPLTLFSETSFCTLK
ncbi:UNVERIFIED_CONTAM: hypothetical protein Sradi_2305700 [Sesamum radiatum]|uniref:Uncharacterized protein n=1 Tax=Sesamum radiatum TaxID=300843 RepID=A0AAW2T4B1_SESRA